MRERGQILGEQSKQKKETIEKQGPVSLLLEFPVFELLKFFEFYLSTYKFRLVFIGSSITIKKSQVYNFEFRLFLRLVNDFKNAEVLSSEMVSRIKNSRMQLYCSVLVRFLIERFFSEKFKTVQWNVFEIRYFVYSARLLVNLVSLITIQMRFVSFFGTLYFSRSARLTQSGTHLPPQILFEHMKQREIVKKKEKKIEILTLLLVGCNMANWL